MKLDAREQAVPSMTAACLVQPTSSSLSGITGTGILKVAAFLERLGGGRLPSMALPPKVRPLLDGAGMLASIRSWPAPGYCPMVLQLLNRNFLVIIPWLVAPLHIATYLRQALLLAPPRDLTRHRIRNL